MVFSHFIHMQAINSRLGEFLARAGSLVGKESVLIFFVLSGFVLFISIEADRAFSYRSYLIKRVARIWLPFAFAILLAAVLWMAVKPTRITGLNEWFNNIWLLPPTPSLVAGHLLMTDSLPWQSLNPVMWSLVYEMRISILFPLVALMISRKWWVALLVWLAVSVVSLAFHKSFSGVFTPMSALRYVWLFASGACLALHRGTLRTWYEATPPWGRLILYVATALVVVAWNERLENVTTPIAALAVVFVCTVDDGIERKLLSPVLLWLGKVSYSLYLIHLPILMATTHLLYERVPMAVILATSLLIILIGSELMYRFVEGPSMTIGRSLSRWAKRKDDRQALPVSGP